MYIYIYIVIKLCIYIYIHTSIYIPSLLSLALHKALNCLNVPAGGAYGVVQLQKAVREK